MDPDPSTGSDPDPGNFYKIFVLFFSPIFILKLDKPLGKFYNLSFKFRFWFKE